MDGKQLTDFISLGDAIRKSLKFPLPRINFEIMEVRKLARTIPSSYFFFGFAGSL